MQSVIDPTIQTLIENGRQAAAARQAQEVEAVAARQAADLKLRDEDWTALKTAVAQQLPAEIAEHAVIDRDPPNRITINVHVTIRIEHLHHFYAVFTKGRKGWILRNFLIIQQSVTGENCDNSRFEPNELHLCLAEVARLTEWQAARKTAVLDYEVAVAKWHWEHTNKSALIKAMTEILQKQVCEDHGDSFALWQIHYSYFEFQDGEVQGTVVVLENETDSLGFWRVVNTAGQVRRIAYANVFAVEDLGDWQVTQKEYTRRHYSRTFGTIYLPPYVTEEEFAASGKMVDLAQAAAPELTERPRPHDMEAAGLFEDWELDWLYHNTGGDADN